MVTDAHGCEKISSIFTKYVNNSQQGMEKIQPNIFEKIPDIDDKNPKIINHDTMGNTNMLVMVVTNDIVPKLYTIIGTTNI